MKVIIAILFALVLSACAGSGAIKWDDVRELKVGMTAEEVTKKLGKPAYIRTRGDTEIWQWIHVNVLTGSNENMFISMKDGVVIAVPKVPESFK